MSTPVPSNLVLLSDLELCAPGTKVRFLGWYALRFPTKVWRLIAFLSIDEYIVKTATLRLKHHYPSTGPCITANVDVEHVLEKLRHDAVDVGAWLNVIGYVEQGKAQGIHVQAVAVWDAGNVDVAAYAQAIEKRKAAR